MRSGQPVARTAGRTLVNCWGQCERPRQPE